MIRHGANIVFSSRDSMVTEDDINSILERGELKVRPTMHTTKHIVMIVISDS